MLTGAHIRVGGDAASCVPFSRLYAPLRVLIYEDADGKTCIEYDRPSSLFGQFGNEQVAVTTVDLDRKVEELVGGAVR
jgi:uncharacterized protein (DUF302 family)